MTLTALAALAVTSCPDYPCAFLHAYEAVLWLVGGIMAGAVGALAIESHRRQSPPDGDA